MDASKQLWRRAGENPIKVAVAILVTALLAATLAFVAVRHAGTNNHLDGSSTSSSSNNGGWIKSARSLLRDPLAFFTQRSPGARSSRELIQSKHRMFKLPRQDAKKPHEQVLANVRYPSAIPDYLNDLIAPVQPGLFDMTGYTPTFVGPGPVGGGPGVPPPVVPIGFPGGGTPGGGPGGNSPVPEPGTWLTLIFGMGMIGIGLRSKHRRVAKGVERRGFRVRI